MKGGNTAAHLAFKDKNEEIILTLIEYNCDLNQVNDKNLTPLAYGNEQLLKILNLLNGSTTIMSGPVK